jgi:glutamyl endopeptidase
MEKKILSISNSGELADFENKTLPTPFTSVEGVDNNSLENLADFKLRNSDWFEELPNDVQNLPNIGTLNEPKSVCGNDDRILINPQNTPYRFICSIIITASNGSRYIGSGFL